MALEEYAGDMNMCCRCSACKFVPLQMVKGFKHANVCPSISRYSFHYYSGGGRLNMGVQGLDKGFTYTPRYLDSVYNCQMCGACDVSCKFGMDMEVLRPVQELRIKAVQDGHAHPALEKVVARMRKTGTMVAGRGKRGAWAEGLGLTDATKQKVDVLYHVGCLTSYDEDMQKVAKATAAVLKKAGVKFGILGDAETCCGARAYEMGYEADFLAQAAKSMEAIKKSGAKTLVISCATCYQAYNVLYDRFGLKGDLEVLHISQLMTQLIEKGKLKPKKKLDLNVTYHDPCHLGRLGEPWIHWEGKKVPGDRFIFEPQRPYRRGTNGVYEPPREVLAALPGVTLTEMDRIMEYAWCSGACGGVTDSNPEFAEWTANERIEEALCTGAGAIVTADPWSEKLFNDTMAKNGGGLKVYDLVELVAQAI
ncbi:MAG: (Fe-S)-binding protein [Thermoleophilia bacterium]|nr:(Fe-S)-binding protein [Thermoleophilia bacterium]